MSSAQDSFLSANFRGVPVIGVCSASSAPTVLSNGATAVLDRNRGGLASRPEDLNLEVVIDCVGGQEVEDASREALGNKGNFVTAAGPGDGSFGPGIDSVKGLMGHMFKATARSFKVVIKRVIYHLLTFTF